MLRDFPSLMAVQIHPRVPDPSTAKRLIGNVLSSLKDSGTLANTVRHTGCRWAGTMHHTTL